MERLQKVMSNCGVASRRASEQMILDGRVRVNGVVIRELGTKVDPDKDIVLVDGQRLEIQLARSGPQCGVDADGRQCPRGLYDAGREERQHKQYHLHSDEHRRAGQSAG